MRLQIQIFLLLLLATLCRGGTVVSLGTVSQFTGPADAALDLSGQFDYAINFSADDPVRTVNGVTFTPDTQAIPGATLTLPQLVTGWQAKPEYGASADANSLEEIMHDIRWADAGSGQKVQASLVVTTGIVYKLQLLISGNHTETRRWDIRINGLNAVDEITSLGISPGETYATNRSVVYSYQFTPTTSPLVVEMGNFFGGNDGGDRNPIWQALTLERVYIPPTPADISLVPAQFFPSQTGYIGNFLVSDLKGGATHTLALVAGTGSADNAKFTLSGGQLLPQPFNFSAQPPGTAYSIRVRATDAADGARFLEKAFTVTLATPRAPTAVTLNASSLSTGLITGQQAALIAATDPDITDRHTFALVSGAGAVDNGLFTISGNELRMAAALPLSQTSVSLRLRATDLSGLSVETAFTLPVTVPRIRINEVLAVAVPGTLPLDENSQPRDWIELFNEQPQPVNLAGWHLTDDPANLTKWTFPTAAIAPSGYLIVFASGTGATPASGQIHTNFTLSQSGERLLLVRPDGVIASDVNPPELYPNTTWGTAPGGVLTGHLRTPTPGAANSAIASVGRNDVLFSVPHGHYSAAFPLTLTATAPGSTIYYTLDGTAPTTASAVYSAPVTITPVVGTTVSGTRIVRAMAANPDAAYTPVTTQTYLFVNGVAGPNTDGIVGQTNLYASIKTHPTYGPLLDDALLALPAVSLVINNNGDLPYGETESSLELFDPQGGEPGFTVPAGVARSGTTSLSYAKGSMSARFRGEYGLTKLVYPVYGRHPYDALGATDEFQELRLRSGSHDTHSWIGLPGNPSLPYGNPPVTRDADAQLIRNIWIEDQQLIMGQPGKHGRMVQLFVNGNYFGIYHIQEHPDDDYMGSYYPGTSDDYHFTGGATTGSLHGTESWATIWAQMKASLGNYTEAKRWVDVTNLADYMVLSFYIGNDWDWTTQHNWSAAGPRLPDRGGWKFFSQDQDVSLQEVNADSTDQNVPDGVFTTLMTQADFKILFRDRLYKHLFHDGLLTPAKALATYQYRANEIFTAIVAETARWQPTSSQGPLPWDRDGEWTVERNYLTGTFFPGRTAALMSQVRARGWYPLDAPEMSQWGGAVPSGTQISLTGPAGATLYYTLDGSDPRLPGGGLNPAALASTSSTTTQTLVQSFDDVPGRGAVWKYYVASAYPDPAWKTSAYSDAAWPQGAVEAGYGDGDEVSTVPFVDTDPVTSGTQRNISTLFRHTFTVANTSSITGLTLRIKRDDGAVVYLNGLEIFRTAMPAGTIAFTTPGNSGTNVTDDGNTWFTKTLTPAEYTLNNGSNLLAVEVHNASAISGDLSFDLDLNASVTLAAQPILITSATTLKTRALLGAEWSAINEAPFYLTGTQPAATANLTLTEIQYNPEGAGAGDAEFLEFQNTGASAVDVSGVQIGGAVVFTFPSGIVLLPGEFIVVVKDQALFSARYRTVSSPWYHAGIRVVAGAWSGSLSNSGEQIIVRTATDAPLFTFSYSDAGAWPGRADGRGSSLELASPGSVPATLAPREAWLGAAGNWRPSSEFHGSPGWAGTGPDQRLAINEVLSASQSPATDFIELLNISSSSQSVGGWFLSDSADNYRKFKIPAGTSLAPGGYLVFNETQFNNPGNPASLVPFSLDSAGDDVFLLEADTAGNLLKFADRVEFASAPGGMTFGRSPNGTGSFDLLRASTPGNANAASLPQYATWIATAFPLGATPADTAPGADPDHDGLSNLLEFALGLPPLIPDATPILTQPSPGGSVLQFSVTVRTDVPGLTTRFDVSSDLGTWDTREARIQRLTTTPGPGNTATITARLAPADPAARTFLRLTIVL